MTQYLSPDGFPNPAPPTQPPHRWISEREQMDGRGTASITEPSADAIDAGEYEPFPPVRRDHLSRYHKPSTASWQARSSVSVGTHDLPPHSLPLDRPVRRETAAEDDGLAIQLDDAWGRFESQVELINRLGQEQESAIVDLKAIANEVSTLWQAIAPEDCRSTAHLLAIDAEHRGLSHVQADAQGTWWLTLRPIDWQRSNHLPFSTTDELRRIAQQRQQRFLEGDRPWSDRSQSLTPPRFPARESKPLHRTASASQPVSNPVRRSPQPGYSEPPRPAIAPPREEPRPPEAQEPGRWQRLGDALPSGMPPLGQGLAQGIGQVLGWVFRKDSGRIAPPDLQPRSRPHRSSRRSRHAQAQSDGLRLPDFSLKGAALWICGAAVARAMINLLRVALPGWQPLWLLLLLLPAAIAIYQVRLSPASGFVAAYRLSLILVGLLMGGRL